MDTLVVVSYRLVQTISGCDFLLNYVKSDKYTLSKLPLKSHSQSDNQYGEKPQDFIYLQLLHLHFIV